MVGSFFIKCLTQRRRGAEYAERCFNTEARRHKDTERGKAAFGRWGLG